MTGPCRPSSPWPCSTPASTTKPCKSCSGYSPPPAKTLTCASIGGLSKRTPKISTTPSEPHGSSVLDVISLGWLDGLSVVVGIVGRLVPDELWELFQRVVPEAPSRPQGGGRRRHGDREVLAAIAFVATSGCTPSGSSSRPARRRASTARPPPSCGCSANTTSGPPRRRVHDHSAIVRLVSGLGLQGRVRRTVAVDGTDVDGAGEEVRGRPDG